MDRDLVRPGSWKQEHGEAKMQELLGLAEPPDAVFTTNIELALGALLNLKRSGVRVPDDIGVIAFSDYDWTRIIEPPLSVADFPIESIGKRAVELLIEKIEHKSAMRRNAVVRIKTSLKIRGSTRKRSVS